MSRLYPQVSTTSGAEPLRAPIESQARTVGGNTNIEFTRASQTKSLMVPCDRNRVSYEDKSIQILLQVKQSLYVSAPFAVKINLKLCN